MAHLIDQTTGKASFISYQAAAWHGLGTTKTSGHITLDDCLEDGGLKFIVNKAANSHHLPSGRIVTSTESFFTYRTDNETVLGDKTQ